MQVSSRRTTLILSDIDCTRYPQPVYLARSIAEHLGSAYLLDPLGLHYFDGKIQTSIRRSRTRYTSSALALLWARFVVEMLRLRPHTVIAVNETNLAPLRIAAQVAPGTVRFGAYLLDFWEDDLAVKTTRLRLGHRALSDHASWLDFVIDCESERLALRSWVTPRRHKTFVLHNTPPRASVPALDRIPGEGRPRVLYAGRNDPNVALERFIEALSKVNRWVDVDFFLTGYEDRNRRIMRKVMDCGLGERVRIHPSVAKERLWEVMARADIGLAFYPCHQGQTNLNDFFCAPNKVFEYIAAGLAVLASSNPTLQFIEREGLGVCVNPRDIDSIVEGLERMLDGESFCAMGRRAREYYAASFSYEKEVAPILDYLASPTETRP